MPFQRIAGKNNRHAVTLYALSTCGWCRMTKELLNRHGIEYQFIDVDLTIGPERDEIMNQVRQFNPRGSFPTILIDDRAVIGYDEERIKELLEI
ncbi:MAG: glutaredoxin family protein [candidate division WOR-3 bacterium]